MKVVARAHPNIALIKYWGKQDVERNLPAVGSVSITLDQLHATTELSPARADAFQLNGREDLAGGQRVAKLLDRLRELKAQPTPPLDVVSQVNFPVAAGLASSAAGFAALAVGAAASFELELSILGLARVAGGGSGSAARSLYGGFVRLDAPASADADIDVRQLASADHWALKVVIAITDKGPKAMGSGPAMRATAASSPFYPAWCENQIPDIDQAEAAVIAKDFDRLAELAEASCLKMHAVAMAANPGILYWKGATVEAIHHIRALRAAGVGTFFTIDAGPQVKAICLEHDADRVERELADLPGVVETMQVGLGPGATCL